MKFMDKVKNFFTEEVEEEVKPIKKEMIQVEIPSPETRSSDVKETKVEEKIVEKVVEEKKPAPIYFDDKDFLDLEKNDKKIEQERHRNQPKQKKYRSSFMKKEDPVIEGYNGRDKKEEKKIFKPSPIISPVYGVLDKNYSKDDIVSKNDTKKIKYSSVNEVTIDDVRNKAYGTLEDDLESTLFNDFEDLKNDDGLFDDLKDDVKVELDVEEKPSKDIDDFINEGGIHQDYYSDEELEAISDDSKDNLVSEELDSLKDDDLDLLSEDDKKLEDNDLFDLIDSMYEKKEDE